MNGDPGGGRIGPVDPAELNEETAALVALTENADGHPLAVIATLAHRPELVGPFLTWSAALAAAPGLGPRRHELVALRAAWRFGSDYEWGHHAEYARRAGLSDDEIRRCGEPGLAGWTAAEQALLSIVDGMCTGGVDDTVWATAAEHHEPAELVELAWTVAQYGGLSMVTRALGVALEPGVEHLPGTDDHED